jgi:death-on-curing protein
MAKGHTFALAAIGGAGVPVQLARNHALIDGNKRLALAAVIAFCGLNGRRLTLTNDQAYDLVMKVAAGELDQVEEIAAILQAATAPRQ